MMQIIFDHVVPHPLRDSLSSNSQIWNSKCCFEKGKNYIINASSGKGKTTFTHLICGIRNDYDGQIANNGKDLKGFSDLDWSNWRYPQCSFVFQDLQLFPQLSVRENLLIQIQLGSNVNEEQVKSWLKELRILDKWEVPICKLSMGQQQRVAIARALIPTFNWLILDEPFSHLDLKNVAIAHELIQNRCKENQAGSILLVLDPPNDIHADFIFQL
jgi:ABC-type lipoprotein export system ATPase subunit